MPDLVVNNLPAVSDAVLTQPWATVASGVLAIIAAGVAFAGVRYAQKVAIASTKAQLRVQTVASLRQERQHAAQLSATADLEREKHTRETTYTALSDALDATMTARDAVLGYRQQLVKDELQVEAWHETLRSEGPVTGDPVAEAPLTPVGAAGDGQGCRQSGGTCSCWDTTTPTEP